MNPHWPYTQFSIPPPNFTGPPQPLQQNSWTPVNPASVALPAIPSQVPVSSNIIPLNAALSSMPPPQSSLVVQPSYQFNVPPPGIFPTNIPPPNLFPQSVLPSMPPPVPVSAVPELQSMSSIISPAFQAPVQPSYVTYPIQTGTNTLQNVVNHPSYTAQSSKKHEEITGKLQTPTSNKDCITLEEKIKKAQEIYKDISSSIKQDSKKHSHKEEKSHKDSYKKASSPDPKSSKIEKDVKTSSKDIKDENKNEKLSSKTSQKVRHKDSKENKRERSSSSHSRTDRRRHESSSRSSSHSKKTEKPEKRKREQHHSEENELKGTKKIKQECESPNRRPNIRRRRSSPEDLPCLSYKAYKYLQCSAAEKYYSPKEDSKIIVGKDSLVALHKRFKYELVDRAERCRAFKPKYEPPIRKTILRKPKPPKEDSDDESSSSSEKSSSEEEDTAMEELERKKKHPDRLHLELWFNDPKEMNDGPLCRCSAKARRAGIRHGIYVGEDHLPLCDPLSNNADRLFHYRITITPHTNFLTNNPTTVHHKGHDYRFEGFSLFSHSPLPKLPNCKVIRFNYEYTILYSEEEFPKNFTVEGLELFSHYLLFEVLELVDINWKAHDDPDGCPRFHIMPRFSRELKDGGKELLAHCYVLDFLLKENKILVNEEVLPKVLTLPSDEWQDLADDVKGMIVTCPGMKPSSIRVDQLDREQCSPSKEEFPVIVHFGVRPPQLSYAGNPLYQKAWRDYVKFRHLLANKPKVKYLDRHKLIQKEDRLQAMRMENDLKRDVTVVVSSKNFYKTGIMSDIVQHAMLLPVLICHLRFHQSLSHLEDKLSYQFQDRYLLQLALTHPSYRENFGTNPDHARNSLTNCGLRQPQYGDRRIHYMNTRKRGINTLINIMSRFGSQKESVSSINHNERLEFLGDAVVEFLSSIHLFYMFPDLEEGGLATYRAAIVQNQHLAVLSRKLELDRFMLYAHGSDLCHDLELRHAMANCFEALMGALFLDNGIEVADKVFSQTLFSEQELLEVWKNFPPHPLQEQEPDGDRKWIEHVPLLQKLHEFEETIGIEFNHIRLLARALTHRSLGYNNLTLGSNQRLEFLGDTVLQLVASEYLYKFFPDHHEGHLSLLRSSLVNNRTQAVVCADLGMVDYAIYPYEKVELKPKDKADLLEAFLGALYVDKDLGYCKKFCEVCFFPRLQDFIMNQDWNDPKSKLQQCCLTLRSMDGGEPDIPTYKVIECKGPTNTRVYSVAVYFQSNRLAVGSGHSIQQAEMDAADNALKKSKDLFPQLRHQRRAIERSLKQGPPTKRKNSPSKWRDSPQKHRKSPSKHKNLLRVEKGSFRKKKDSLKKHRSSPEKTKDPFKKRKDSSHKHSSSPERIKESSKKQKDSSKKHRNSSEKTKESSKKLERFLDESSEFSRHVLGRLTDLPEKHKDSYKHKRSLEKLKNAADKQQELVENRKESSEAITDSFEKPEDLFIDHRDSLNRIRDPPERYRDPSEKYRDLSENHRKFSKKHRDSPEKFRESSKKPRDSPERLRESSKKLRDSPEKLRQSSKKHKDSSAKHNSKKHRSSLQKRKDSPRKSRDSSKKHKNSPKKHKHSSKKIRDSAKLLESSKSHSSKTKHSNSPRCFT